MENVKVNNLAEALCEVRKAHRLIFSYQERMLSLIRFIRNKLDFNTDFIGIKHFSDTIPRYKGGNELRLNDSMWAWDFIYSYVFEYYVGSIKKDKSEIYLSIIQYTDTGYFDSNTKNQLDITSFVSPEDSESKLLFLMECAPGKCELLLKNFEDTKQFVLNKEYASKEHKETVLFPKGEGKNRILMYSIPIERFVDEANALEALKEYLAFLKSNGIELEIV